jgi:hypothetical protein
MYKPRAQMDVFHLQNHEKGQVSQILRKALLALSHATALRQGATRRYGVLFMRKGRP